MATDTASRASMDMRSMSSQGAAADRGRRTATLEESMRNVAGQQASSHYATENPAINLARTPDNIDLVNDGEGGFRPARSIDEVVAYGDARVARVTRAIKAETVGADGTTRPGERFALTGVFHLPLDMCEPDGTTYHPLDDNGQPKDGLDGRPFVELKRLRAKDPEAMRRYFDDVLGYQTENVIPGGHDAIHGVAINLDESRPHMQILFDPFENDPRGKEPGALKSGYSKAFGRHPKDAIVEKLDRRTGKTKMAREGADGKMMRYHAEMKQYLLDRGWAVEAERDPVRHDRRESNPDYQNLRDEQAAAANTAVMLEEAVDIHRDGAAAAKGRLDAREQRVNDAAEKVQSDRETLDNERASWERTERPRLVSQAKSEGRAAGYAEAAPMVNKAREDAAAAATERAAAEADRRAAREARERAEQSEAEAAERVEQRVNAAAEAGEEAIREAAQRAIENMPKPRITDDNVADLYTRIAKQLPYKGGKSAHDLIMDRMPEGAAALARVSGKSVKHHMERTVKTAREEGQAKARESQQALRDAGRRSPGRSRDDGMSM